MKTDSPKPNRTPVLKASRYLNVLRTLSEKVVRMWVLFLALAGEIGFNQLPVGMIDVDDWQKLSMNVLLDTDVLIDIALDQ